MLKGIFLIIGAATCWGMGGVAGQYLYQYHQADMIWLCMARQILAGCMFLLFAAFTYAAKAKAACKRGSTVQHPALL